MTKTLSEQVAQLEKELAEAKAKLAEEANKKPVTKGFEEPVWEQPYWYVNGGRRIRKHTWTGHPVDFALLSMGNVFLTEEAAEKRQRQLKTIAELRRMTNGFVPKLSDGWYEIIRENDGTIVAYFRAYFFAGDIPRYRTKEEAQAAINAVGVDRIKELMEV